MRLAIFGVGLCCPSGKSFAEANDKYYERERFLRRESSLIGVDGLHPTIAPIYEYDKNANYVDRLRTMLDVAIGDCLNSISLGDRKVRLLLGLNTIMGSSPSRPAFARSFERRRLPSIGGAMVVFGGNAVGIDLLMKAAERVRDGDDELIVIAALDCLLHHEILDLLSVQGRVLCKQNPYGMVPGEGCAALLLGKETDEVGGPPMGFFNLIVQKSEGEDVLAPKGVRGNALAQCVGAVSTNVDRVLVDLNGERFRAEEYGFAAARSKASVKAAMMNPEVPPLQIGDLGAATSLVYCGLALAGETRHRRSLVLASSWEDGMRAATVVERA
jgi:3-oxoacyl-[acyl-carrier-protein] synthase-1